MRLTLCIAACLSTATVHTRAGEMDVPSELKEHIAEVVGKVGHVLSGGQDPAKLHESLKSRFKDTPDLEVFSAQERWVTVISSTSLRYPGIYLGRSAAEAAVQMGDIVHMKVIPNFRRVSSYTDLNQVTEVLCRAGTPDYDRCALAHPLAWLDKSGGVLRIGK